VNRELQHSPSRPTYNFEVAVHFNEVLESCRPELYYPKVKLARTTWILICAFLFLFPLYADPANVLVGDLTFTRPEAWMWESASSKSKALTRFIIPDPSGKPTTTDVRFYLGQKNPEVASALWKSYFPQAKEADIREEKKKIGKHELTYVSVSGAYIFPGNKPRPGCTFFGAVIPSGNNFVHVRILGPKNEVEMARSQFEKMVEEALKEAE
jgi:hypothetical protein